jgi:hypothetical protein
MAKHQFSRAAYERMQAEFDDLSTRGRHQVADKIERARELGDLKENGDYHAAKDEQGHMEGRIRQLEYLLENGEVIEDGPEGEVRVGQNAFSSDASKMPATFALIGLNVVVFLFELFGGGAGSLNGGGQVIHDAGLRGPDIANGDWWHRRAHSFAPRGSSSWPTAFWRSSATFRRAQRAS